MTYQPSKGFPNTFTTILLIRRRRRFKRWKHSSTFNQILSHLYNVSAKFFTKSFVPLLCCRCPLFCFDFPPRRRRLHGAGWVKVWVHRQGVGTTTAGVDTSQCIKYITLTIYVPIHRYLFNRQHSCLLCIHRFKR